MLLSCVLVQDLYNDMTRNWHIIEQPKQNLINQCNAKENCNQIAHTYKVDDLVLIKMSSHLNMVKMPITVLGQFKKYKTTDLLKF